MGHIYGSFTIHGKELISEYQSEKNQYRGNERFVYKNDNKYIVEGELLKDGELVSSWKVTLERQPTGTSTKHH